MASASSALPRRIIKVRPGFRTSTGVRIEASPVYPWGASRDPIPGAESPRASSPRKRTKIRPASFADHARTSRTRPLH